MGEEWTLRRLGVQMHGPPATAFPPGDSMRSILTLAVVFLAVSLVQPCQAERGPLFGARRGPWIAYRYPLFRDGNRPQHVRDNAGDYYRVNDGRQWYPKYYGGFHARDFNAIGTPPGDRGFRGSAW